MSAVDDFEDGQHNDRLVGTRPESEAEPIVRPRRITGIDMARGIAMFGMVVVHFVAFRQDEGAALAITASAFRGRAMPLFMMLGGVGVTFLTSRSRAPERDLVIRAIMVFALGLVLTEYVDRLAIVLQSYGLFFVLSTVLYRLPSRILLALVPVVTAIGGYTYQVVGEPRTQTMWSDLLARDGVESLVFDGFYPLFPIAAFFIFGIWLGRIDLRSDRVASMLLGIGSAVGMVGYLSSVVVVSSFDVQTDFGGNAGDGMFHPTRLLSIEAHSSMPVWVVSALASSAAVLGLSLLVAARFEAAVRPVIAVGSMSLTFYVYQALLTNVAPDTADMTIGEEWLLTISLYLVFVVFALAWQLRFRSGPLEWILRVGSGSKKPAASLR